MADLGSLLGAAGVGGNIGKAIVQLELDSKKYSTELKAAETQTRSFSSIAATGMAAAGAAFVAFGVSSVKAAIESEKVLAQLRQTVGGATQAFEKQAEALQLLTGYQDEQILSADTVLARFKLTDEQVRRTIPTVLDYARATGKDVPDAAELIGKALLGNTRALKAVGIEYTATGDRATDLDNVLTLLNAKVGGSAVAFGKTAAGALAIFQTQVDELQEQVGKTLLPALTSAAKSATDLVHSVGPVLVVVFDAAAAAIETAAENLSDLAEPIEQILDHLPQLRSETDRNAFSFKTLFDILQLGDPTRFLHKLEDAKDVLADLGIVTDDTAESTVGLVDQFLRLADVVKIRYVQGLQAAGNETSHFAHMTKKDLQKWATDTESSFTSFVLALDETAEATRITSKEFRDAFARMRENAGDLNRAMKQLRDEDWINDKFLKFLSEQGPEWLIKFAGLNTEKQRKFQEDWEASNQKLQGANTRFEKMIGLLGDLDSGTTRHDVVIRYRYEGFDPTKPGMSGQ